MLYIVCLVVCALIAYLFGSINFAIIVTKAFTGKDIRDCGSKNAGMTNVLRTVGKTPAFLTLLGDFSKGLLAVLIARLVFTFIVKDVSSFTAEYICAICALLGHVFPIYYGFKGGKGILVSSGALVMLAPYAFLCSLVVFIIAVAITRIVSVGSILSSIAFPIALYFIRVAENASNITLEVILASCIALFIILMHRANIVRLIKGEENKFGSKNKK